MSKIYTRTGDKGKTSLFDGTRVLKSHQRVDTYGTIDELNSLIGLAVSLLNSKQHILKKELEQIQHELLDIGSTLATPHAMPVIGLENRPNEFEKLIDDYTQELPPLTQFILPGGGKAGSMLHVCRTTTRRAERQLVGLMQKEKFDETIIVYLNRLSDLFFYDGTLCKLFREEKRYYLEKKVIKSFVIPHLMRDLYERFPLLRE